MILEIAKWFFIVSGVIGWLFVIALFWPAKGVGKGGICPGY
jgi:hypothetical protein